MFAKKLIYVFAVVLLVFGSNYGVTCGRTGVKIDRAGELFCACRDWIFHQYFWIEQRRSASEGYCYDG